MARGNGAVAAGGSGAGREWTGDRRRHGRHCRPSVSLLQHQGNRGFEKDAPRECSPDLNGIVAGPFEICADGAPRRNGQLERKTRAELASVEHGWILVTPLIGRSFRTALSG